MLARPRMPSLANTLRTRACTKTHACLPGPLSRRTRCVCRLAWLIRLSHDTPHGTPARSLRRFQHPFINIIVHLLQPSSTRLSCCRRVRCLGSALSSIDSMRFYLNEGTVRALSRNQTCDTARTCASKRTHTTPFCKRIPT